MLGPGLAIDCPLDFDQYGSLAYAEQRVRAISYRNDGNGKPHAFGDVLAEGFVRVAEAWGRLSGESSDLKTGRLPFPHWGLPRHKLERPPLDWAYGTIFGDRDMVAFADYLYTQPGATWDGWPEYMPGIREGRWDYVETSGRHFDRQR